MDVWFLHAFFGGYMVVVGSYDGFSHRESHYTRYYKLVVFIIGMTIIPSLDCSNCSSFTVASTIAAKRIIDEN